MQPPPGRSPRERLSLEVKNIRDALEADASGMAVSLASVNPLELERLVAVGGGALGCVLLTLSPHFRTVGAPPLTFDPRRNEHMVSLALQLLVPMVRASDLIVRMGGQEIAALLPGTGPLEARGVGWRLRTALEGRDFWFEEQAFRMSCKSGLAAIGARGVGDDLRSLVDVARRSPLT